MLKHSLLTTSLSTLLLAVPADSNDWTGPVRDEIGGDTLIVECRNWPVEIRLYGVDCPEMNQAYGHAAKKAAEYLTLDVRVTVHPTDYDRYSRMVVRIVLPDGRDLSEVLISQCLPWWFKQYTSDDKTLVAIEKEAAQEKKASGPPPTSNRLGPVGSKPCCPQFAKTDPT